LQYQNCGRDFGGCGDGIGWSAIDFVKTANFANTEIIGLFNYLNEPRRREVREGRTAYLSFSSFPSLVPKAVHLILVDY
jgi:hypothetical protein